MHYIAGYLCVHVQESRPSHVVLCLKGGSVYSSQAFMGVIAWRHAHMGFHITLPIYETEKEHIPYAVPLLIKMVSAVQTH